MTKRLWSLLLCLCFTALLLPNVSFAASGNVYTFYDNQDASYQNGSVVWKSSERTLYLSNATIATEQNGINFSCNGDVTIVLQGTNSITVNNNTTSGVVYALNTQSEKLTIKGTETDGYMGTLTLETKKSKGDNAVIYNFDHLTVENVAHLNVIAGNCSSSKSSYGLWSLGQHQTLQFTNTCVEISVKEAGNYGYAIYNYGDNYADREMDIKFNNSSLKIISKSGRVVRDKKWDGAVYVNDINVGNPQTGTDGYTSTSSGKIVYHYTDSNGAKKTYTQTEAIPSSGQTTKVNYLPQRNGYTFKGWNTKEDGTGAKLTGTSKDVYYYQNGEAVDWNLLQRTNNELHLYEVW